MYSLVFLLLSPFGPEADKSAEEKVRFLRPVGKGFVLESVFTIKKDKGWSIVSVTERGATRMQVAARYDAKDFLSGAEVTLTQKEDKKTAKVEKAGGKVKVQRQEQPAQEFEVPAGTIVTSAPDWTDTFLLCRRYDRDKGGLQSFAGLWIHPIQPAQLLKFTIERTGTDKIEKDGKTMELDRLLIRIRGPNPYLAWAERGELIKLIAMPGGQAVLIREGFEKASASLQAPK